MDERAGELEATPHPARQTPGLPTADVPQTDELEDLAHASTAA
jgi:hypothetical protein